MVILCYNILKFIKEVIIMRAILTVVGKDTVGIMAKISSLCATHNVNIVDINQTVMQDLFCMIMLCDIDNIKTNFNSFSDAAAELGEKDNLSIHVMHEDIFNSMHKI